MPIPDKTFLDQQPSAALLALFDHEKHFTAEHVNKLGPAVQANETALSALARNADGLGGCDWSAQTWPRLVQAQLLCVAVPDLYCAFRLGTQGFPDQSVAVLRTAIEAALRVVFLELHPTPWEAAIMDRRDIRAVGGDPTGTVQFNATNLLAQELGFPELAKWLYEHPSKYAHGNRLMASLKIGGLMKGNPASLTSLPQPPGSMSWDDYVGSYLNLLQIVLWLHLELHHRCFSALISPRSVANLERVATGMREWCALGVSGLAGLTDQVDLMLDKAFPGTTGSPRAARS